MKIVVIGSTQYFNRIMTYANELTGKGYDVRIPAFDNHAELNELQICEHNRDLMEWAERVDIIWDQRSFGTLFDFGMAFALQKPIKIIYLEPKTFAGVMSRYEKQTSEQKQKRSED